MIDSDDHYDNHENDNASISMPKRKNKRYIVNLIGRRKEIPLILETTSSTQSMKAIMIDMLWDQIGLK